MAEPRFPELSSAVTMTDIATPLTRCAHGRRRQRTSTSTVSAAGITRAATEQMLARIARDLVRVPGLLSMARLPLAIAFALSLGNIAWSLGILALAGLSDVLDGWYARRHDQATRAGAVLDAIMDKVFVVVVVVSLVLAHALSLVQVLLLATREVGELAITARLAWTDTAKMTRPHAPHALGKLTTVLQFATVTAAVFRSDVTTSLAFATAIAGIFAAIAYWAREWPGAPRRTHESHG